MSTRVERPTDVEPASPSRRRPRPLGYLAARAARVRPAAAAPRRARSRPTRSSTSISIPAGCSSRARRRCGTRTSGWARSRTRPSATCSRWARTTGSSTSSACPTGSRSGSGSARCCSSRRVGVLYLLRTFGLRGPGVVVAALAYMFTPYVLDYAARISVLLHAVGRAAVDDRAHAQGAARRRAGAIPAIFALVVQVVGGVNATALIFAGRRAGAVDPLRVARRARGRRRGARSASTARTGVLTLAHVAVVDRRACACRARTASTS